MQIISSKQIVNRNLKFFWFGDTGTRKTETILRYFPKVLLIDAEGNADKAADNPEIPEFLLVKTKDAREILNIIEMVANEKIKFTDGSPILTVGVDGISVLWDIGKDVAATVAENRAAHNNRPIDTISPSLRDWNIAKRPLKRIYTALNNSPIKFLVFTAREKILLEDLGNNSFKKIGVTYDAMGGIQYDMNVTLHFQKDETSKWLMEVVKTQGTLNKIFPEGKKLTKFPMQNVLAWADRIQPSITDDKDGQTIAVEQAKDSEKMVRNMENLRVYAGEMGIIPQSK